MGCLQRSDRELARSKIAEQVPDFVIGAPPYTDFCQWNQYMKHPKMPEDIVKRRMEEARMHLKVMCEIYRDRHRKGKWFLHEHPAYATSWNEPSIEKILQLSGVDSIRADPYQFELVTPSHGERKPALKPT